MSLLETIPQNASQTLLELKGADLLEFFRKIHWNMCLKVLLLNLSDDELRELLEEIIDALPEEHAARLNVGSAKEELLDDIVLPYRTSIADKSTSKSIVGDVLRAWACRSSDESGRSDVAREIDIVFVKEHAQRQSTPISKDVASCGLTCSEKKQSNGEPSPFHVNRMWSSVAHHLLTIFWEACVPVTCADGFIGRFYDEEAPARRKMFVSHWMEIDISGLDVHEVSRPVDFFLRTAMLCLRLYLQICAFYREFALWFMKTHLLQSLLLLCPKLMFRTTIQRKGLSVLRL